MFIEKVEAYCKENNLSIHGFDKLCGLSYGSVSKWAGSFGPSLPTIKKIVNATNTPVEKWLED